MTSSYVRTCALIPKHSPQANDAASPWLANKESARCQILKIVRRSQAAERLHIQSNANLDSLRIYPLQTSAGRSGSVRCVSSLSSWIPFFESSGYLPIPLRQLQRFVLHSIHLVIDMVQNLSNQFLSLSTRWQWF